MNDYGRLSANLEDSMRCWGGGFGSCTSDAECYDSEIGRYMAVLVYPWFLNFRRSYTTVTEIKEFVANDNLLSVFFIALMKEATEDGDAPAGDDVLEHQYLVAQSLTRAILWSGVERISHIYGFEAWSPQCLLTIVDIVLKSPYWSTLSQHCFPTMHEFMMRNRKSPRKHLQKIGRAIVSLVPDFTLELVSGQWIYKTPMSPLTDSLFKF